QAFHWFRAGEALREFHRVLGPDGWVALLWNERAEDDPATAAYGVVIRAVPGAEAVEGPRQAAGQALLETPLFADRQRLELRHGQFLDEDGLRGRAFSASYVPQEGEVGERVAEGLRKVFARFQEGGRVRLEYVTTLYLGRRLDPPAA